MTVIFEFRSYREYLEAWIVGLGTRAHGARGRIAAALGVSSSLVSQIFKGEKTLTPDQASDLADFLGLGDLESEYLHLLVDFERAASHRFRAKLEKKIAQARERSRKIGSRVPRAKELTDEQRAIYYSSWLYTGVRNLSAVPGMDDAESIAAHLRVEPAVVKRVLRFLLEQGLCREDSGKITYGPASTHVDRDSPFVNKHHQNWRFRAIHQMDRRHDADVFFTSPMSLSRAAIAQIRDEVPNFIQKVMKISGPSDSEAAACLNLDWFEY